MDIIVLAGGLSTERDVSFKTGSMVASALKENGHRVIPPWSFTPVWYWGPAVHVQDRWEAVNLERQFQGSHCWDTTLVLLGF